MTWVDLGEPVPRGLLASYECKRWSVGGSIVLCGPTARSATDLPSVLSKRRTNRSFRALQLVDLSSLLWLTCRTEETVGSPLGFPIQFRPLPSAGAIHPVHLVIQLGPDTIWHRYDPLRHELAEIPESMASAKEARTAASGAMEVGGAALIGLVAEYGMTAAKYDASCSLVWRDAGVILGYLSLVSEALGLNFCPLGLTGDEQLRQLDEQGRLRGVGLALLGAR